MAMLHEEHEGTILCSMWEQNRGNQPIAWNATHQMLCHPFQAVISASITGTFLCRYVWNIRI